MTATPPAPDPDDLLARAEAALRDAPVPDGPTEDAIARTRAALRTAAERPILLPFHRRRTMIATLKFTAAALAAAAGLSYLVVTPRAVATVAFVEAVQKLRDARTLAYRISVQVPGQEGPTTGRDYYKDPGLVRTEIEQPQAAVTIMDTNRGKLLSLDPSSKVALLQDWNLNDDLRRRTRDGAMNAIEHLRALAGKEGKPVGKRRIGAVEAQGFRVEMDGQAWTAWIDPERKFPVLMETTLRFDDKEVPATLSDFQIDPKLDDALFALEPPRGYALQKVEVPIAIREEALVNLLRVYAENSGGTFPPRPDDREAFQKQFPKEKFKGPADPRMIRVVQSMAASVVFLQFELKGTYGYRAEGVKLGDADKVLFWYRPKGSEKYRAVFGDLHVEDVTADRLPEKPKF